MHKVKAYHQEETEHQSAKITAAFTGQPQVFYRHKDPHTKKKKYPPHEKTLQLETLAPISRTNSKPSVQAMR